MAPPCGLFAAQVHSHGSVERTKLADELISLDLVDLIKRDPHLSCNMQIWTSVKNTHELNAMKIYILP